MKALLLLLLFTLVMPSSSLAQTEDAGTDPEYQDSEQPSDQEGSEPDLDLEEDLPENFTGTLADEEDEDNPEFKRRKQERDAFGSDRRKKGDEDELPEDDTPTWLLKFTFDSQVIFSDEEGQPYMEIHYQTTIEQEVALIQRRWRTKSEAKFTTDISGNLAGNDLFTCKLDIAIDSFGADLMTRLKHIEETEEQEEAWQAAVQIRLKKDYKEDWFSNCSDVTGNYNFNTSGPPERHNFTILENIIPSLNGIVIEEFDPDNGGELELSIEPFEVVDDDNKEVISYNGSGVVTIEPL